MNLKFSQEVRLGEVLTALGVGLAGVGLWVNLNTEVAQIKEAQRIQSVTNREMREEFRQVASEIKGDIKDLRQEIHAQGKRM